MKDSNLMLKSALASVIAMGVVGISQASFAGGMGTKSPAQQTQEAMASGMNSVSA